MDAGDVVWLCVLGGYGLLALEAWWLGRYK